MVITVKYQTEFLAVCVKDRGLIFSRNDHAVEVNKWFIIWLFKNIQDLTYVYSVTQKDHFQYYCFHDSKTIF